MPRIDMYDIDRLADAHYRSRDPQYEDDMMYCDGCGCRFEYDELTEVGDDFYCAECLEMLKGEDEEEEDTDETEH